MIKAKSDTHVALAAHYGDLTKRAIEILIGTEGNSKSLIRDGVEGTVKSESLTMNILNEQVSIFKGSICLKNRHLLSMKGLMI